MDSSLSEPDCSANAVLCVLGGHPSSSQASAAIFRYFLERERDKVSILHEQQNRENTIIAAVQIIKLDTNLPFANVQNQLVKSRSSCSSGLRGS